MIGVHLPGTLTTSGGFIGWGIRAANLLAATVVLLYVGNLGEHELPARKVVRLLGVLFGVTVAGGVLGVLFGNVNFTSPFELILPHGIRGNYYVHQLTHPGFAQVQHILGTTSPRPKAPFSYTNNWGNNLALLVIWFVVAGWVGGSRRARCWTGISLLFLAFQLAKRGRLSLLAAIAGVVTAGALLVTVTPLTALPSMPRCARPSSDGEPRAPCSGARPRSPIGKTSSCQTCGNAPIGSTGELPQLCKRLSCFAVSRSADANWGWPSTR